MTTNTKMCASMLIGTVLALLALPLLSTLSTGIAMLWHYVMHNPLAWIFFSIYISLLLVIPVLYALQPKGRA
jgi:hypothetical protein